MNITEVERRAVLSRLTRFTGDEHTAEDCLQSALLRLEELRGRTEIANEVGFVTRAAKNLAIDESRRRRIRAHPEYIAEWVEISDDQPLQDEVLLARERLQRARAVLDGLSERTRSIFLMHRLARMKYRAIAERLGVSNSCVEKHIAKAARALSAIHDGD